jgi:hypothetical protein
MEKSNIATLKIPERANSVIHYDAGLTFYIFPLENLSLLKV